MRIYFPKVEIKEYNVRIDGKSVFDQPAKNDKVACENIRKTATGQGDVYTTGCLLDYPYFKENYKMVAIDFSKQQVNSKLLMLILEQFSRIILLQI